jgi:hypothetical protein
MFTRRRETKKLIQIARVLRELDAASESRAAPAPRPSRTRVALSRASA